MTYARFIRDFHGIYPMISHIFFVRGTKIYLAKVLVNQILERVTHLISILKSYAGERKRTVIHDIVGGIIIITNEGQTRRCVPRATSAFSNERNYWNRSPIRRPAG